MQSLKDLTISDLSSVTHDTKVLLFGTSADGAVHYSVKRSGFEDAALAQGADPFGFEPWRKLPLGMSSPDPSVAEYEKENLTSSGGLVLVQSVFNDDATIQSTTGPVRLISALGHLYVLRVSSGRLVVNRFVLDGMTNCLVPKVDVRYRRSKQKYKPQNPASRKGATPFDNLDYRSIDDEVFYEPALRLDFIDDVGDFAVAFTPTAESERNRFHFFVTSCQSSQPVRIYSVGSGKDGLFDVKDYLLGVDDTNDPTKTKYRTISGIIEQKVTLPGDIRSITATTYALQRERFTDDGPMLERGAMRVMVVVKNATTSEASALDYAVAVDGTLSRLGETPSGSESLRDVSRELITPVTLLDDIRTYAAVEPPLGDTIVATERGANDQLRIRSKNALPPGLRAAPDGQSDALADAASRVEVLGTQTYDGHYKVLATDAGSFEIAATFQDDKMGSWEERPEREVGLVYENMVVGTERTPGGGLKVLCGAHDLKIDDEVQLSGTETYDGIYPVSAIAMDRSYFEVSTPFFVGHAANLSRVKRRGLRMDGDDHVRTPDLELPPPVPGRRVERTLSAWIKPGEATGIHKIAEDTSVGLVLMIMEGKQQLRALFSCNTSNVCMDPTPLALDTWVHVTGKLTYTEGKMELVLYRNGDKVADVTAGRHCPFALYPPARPGARAVTATQFSQPGDCVFIENFKPSTAAGTLSMWARSSEDNWATSSNLIGKPGAFKICSVAGSRTLKFSVGLANGGSMECSYTPSDVKGWHHYAMTYNGTTLQVYVDATPATSKTGTSTALGVSDDHLRIGDATNAVRCEIADVRLWDRALSEQEVAQFMRLRSKEGEWGLTGYWPLEQDTEDLSTNKRRGKLAGKPSIVTIARPMTIGAGFKGEIADVQIWERARSSEDIKATMHLILTGRELGLVAYYRMGAIVTEGAEKTVPDFSSHRRDGVVHGDPYAGACNLPRKTAAGLTAVKYESDHLVAVAQLGVYEETFEFKVTPTKDKDPNNIDKLGKIFCFKYWGKSSPSSKDKVDIDPTNVTQDAFEALADGWYRAKCRVTVPQGISMLRAFGVSEVRGDFTSIDIRKHSLRSISDAVTKTTYAHTVTPSSLAGSSPTMFEKLAALTTSEEAAAQYDVEIADLLERLDVVKYKASYEAEKPSLTQQIETLQGQIKSHEAEITRWSTDDRLRYRHKVRPRLRPNELLIAYQGVAAVDLERPGPRDEFWYFESVAGGVAIIPDIDVYSCLMEGEKAGLQRPFVSAVGQGFDDSKIWLIDYPSSATLIKLKKQDLDGRWGTLSPGTSYAKLHWMSGDLPSPEWIIEKTDQVTNASERVLANNRKELAAKQAELALKNTRLARVNEMLSSTETEVSLNTKLTTARTKRTAALTAFATANTEFLTARAAAPAARMPVVATDARGLTTCAAALGFARGSGRFNLTESCEGNLLLSYVDLDGALRTTVYDATADSRNATFEQWLPDSLRACPEVGAVNDKITLEKAVELPAEAWTVEAWVFCPAATKIDGTPLLFNAVTGAEGQTSDAHLALRKGNRLGLLVDGFFFDCGVDVGARLGRGWHHLAAAYSVGTATFYIDGQRLGAREVSQRAIRLNNTRFDTDAYPGPTAAVTVMAWVRSDTATWKIRTNLVSHDNLFTLECAKESRTIKFWVFVNGAWQSVSFTPDDIQDWHMYAACYNGTEIQLYVDGRQVQRVSCSGTMSGASAALIVSAPSSKTDFAGVTVLHRACTPIEIRDAMSKPPIADVDCAGAWGTELKQDESKSTVRDVSSKGRHATIKQVTTTGTATDISMGPSRLARVGTLGNTASGRFPAGRLADVRVWSLCLTDAEVEANYRTRASGMEAGLLASWPLDEGTGTIAREQSGLVTSANGTLNGVEWVGCTAAFGKLPTMAPTLRFDRAGISIEKMPLVANDSYTVECWFRSSTTNTRVFYAGLGCLEGGMALCLSLGKVTVSPDLLGKGSIVADVVGNDNNWHHVCVVYNHGTRTTSFYWDGVFLKSDALVKSGDVASHLIICGDLFVGEISEVRVWRGARSAKEIADNMRRRASGREPNLVACYPLTAVGAAGKAVQDLVSGAWHGTVAGPGSIQPSVSGGAPLPARGDVVTAEYSTVERSGDGATRALMRRFHALVEAGGVTLLPEKRVEELSMEWVGNTQVKPTLLGYIEGAPPVPSENLTVEEDDGQNEGYNEATTVTLTQADDVTYSWQKSEGTGSTAEATLGGGVAWETEIGFGATVKATEGQIMSTFGYSKEHSSSADTAISATSSLTSADSLTLRGMFEDGIGCPRVGKRWLPKNVGYALVISGMADVFVLRLKRSRRMVSSEVRPIDGIPLDVNTITFMINPAYTLNGSLDGMVGSAPADPRLYGDVPALRAQYGALYPASYMRLREAYALKEEIARLDGARSAFFYNFRAQDLEDLDKLGVPPGPRASIGDRGPATGEDSEDNAAAKQAAAKSSAAADEELAVADSEMKAREELIRERAGGGSATLRAGAAFADWQRRMENIQLRAGKRNIANTYVWDGDGGLRVEEQSFAGTTEHTITTETVDGGQLGADVEGMVGSAKGTFSLLRSGSETHAFGKTLSTSRALSLAVDLSGVERRRITDLNDAPIVPGEKVDRYRFMSFYLENDTRHFHEFFRYVVDPEWLMSNDEEARALREAKQAPNRCWRVLHRVTYVERPTLKRTEK